MKTVAIFTDGACSGNPGPGGCAAVIRCGDQRQELSRGYRRTTNNRMELSGAILALRELKDGCSVEITTDSTYVMNAFQEGWIRRWKANGWRTASKHAVQNIDLWMQLDAELGRHDFQFRWVKGHGDHPENNRCDALAVAAAKGADLLVDAGYEQDHPLPAEGQAPVRTVKRGETFGLF